LKYETITGCGEFGIEFSKIDGDGARVSRDFLRRLLKYIVEKSAKYYTETGEHVLTHRERQLHSVVCPSIAEITSSYLMEQPLNRKPAGEEEYRGNVDYWISYRNYSFLMELKHSYFAYRNAENPRKSIAKRFVRAIEQLREIRREECRYLTINKGLIKVALQAVVFYQGSKDKLSKNDLKGQDFKNLFTKLVTNTELKRRSNLLSLWVFDEGLIEIVEYKNGSEIFPAVAFVGNIHFEDLRNSQT